MEVPTQVPAEDVGKGEQFQGQEHPKQTIKPRKHLETSGNTLKTRTTQKNTSHAYHNSGNISCAAFELQSSFKQNLITLHHSRCHHFLICIDMWAHVKSVSPPRPILKPVKGTCGRAEAIRSMPANLLRFRKGKGCAMSLADLGRSRQFEQSKAAGKAFFHKSHRSRPRQRHC